jgi:hypothetical protein
MTEETHMDSRYRAITAQAWSGMLVTLLAMPIVQLLLFFMWGQPAELAESLAPWPGRTGLWVWVCVICLNSLVQVAVRTFDSLDFRTTVFVVSIVYTALFVFQQVVTLALGERFGPYTILDITHNGLALWACWASWQWSRSKSVDPSEVELRQ